MDAINLMLRESYFKTKINETTTFLHKQPACWLLTTNIFKLSSDRLSHAIQQTTIADRWRFCLFLNASQIVRFSKQVKQISTISEDAWFLFGITSFSKYLKYLKVFSSTSIYFDATSMYFALLLTYFRLLLRTSAYFEQLATTSDYFCT